MEANYVIAWESKSNPDYNGEGTATFSFDMALEICRDADRECPELAHYPKRANPTEGATDV